ETVIVIPGIQGRWEWTRPAVVALARRCRVLVKSLPGEPGAGRLPSLETGFTEHVRPIAAMLDSASISRAVICGISFGGLVALRYAAAHPDRVRALILVSTPGPRWKPAPHQVRYMQSPILTLPFFLAGAVGRTWRELRRTFPDPWARLLF